MQKLEPRDSLKQGNVLASQGSFFQTNAIYRGDCKEILRTFPQNSVDLIYLDPPFFSSKYYEVIWGDGYEKRAFEDRWKGKINTYIGWMQERIMECSRVLKDTGTIYVHCDYHANAYLRILLDEIFGESDRNFRNEIIWCYRGAGYPKTDFGRRHDTIFRYSKSENYTFNLDAVREEYAEATKERFKHYIGNVRKSGDFGVQKLNPLGKQPDDWWEIQPIAPSARERLGYPTQKPEKLLERIILASSNPTDIVLDPFCGCGTSIAVAHKLGRRWIGIDVSPTACSLMAKRMRMLRAKDFAMIGMPKSLDDLKALQHFDFQNWVVQRFNGRVSPKKSNDMGIDGYTFDMRPIQVKQSDNVGRNVVDNFETAMRRKGAKEGIIVAFSFSRDANEEAARAKRKDEMNIELIEVSELAEETGHAFDEPALPASTPA
jgi:DNA modification methylase